MTFAQWRRRATAAFVALTIVSAGSAYLGWRDSQQQARQIAAQARDQAISACRARAAGRWQTRRIIETIVAASYVGQPSTPASRAFGVRVRLLLDTYTRDVPPTAAGRLAQCKRRVSGVIDEPAPR